MNIFQFKLQTGFRKLTNLLKGMQHGFIIQLQQDNITGKTKSILLHHIGTTGATYFSVNKFIK